jgi:hypothetical protein
MPLVISVALAFCGVIAKEVKGEAVGTNEFVEGLSYAFRVVFSGISLYKCNISGTISN